MTQVGTWASAFLVRGLLLGLVWIFFAGWEADYAVYGVISVTAATALSLGLLPPSGPARITRWPRRLWFSLVLAGWFIGQSVAGGVDVALRALRRTPDIEPAVVRAPIQLPAGHGRELALLMMNLMPGSMAQRVTDGAGTAAEEGADGPVVEAREVELHTLAEELDPARQWAQLQRRVWKATGAPISPDHSWTAE